MFDIGLQELIIIFLVALLVFGPDQLPDIARKLGRWTAEIRKGILQAKLQMDSELEGEFKRPSEDVPSELLPKAEASEEEVTPAKKEGIS